MYYLTPNDFQGKFELHTGMYNANKLQEYIDRYEPLYMIQLFGAKMYDDYVSDMGIFNVPMSPNYQKLYNPFHENYLFGQLNVSTGLIDMLKGFVYFEYCKDLTNQMTINGNVLPMNENSTTATTLYTMMYARYNESVKTYKAIQRHILSNQNAPLGQVVSASMTNQGTGYIDAIDVPVTGGSGSGALVAINETGGVIDSTYFTFGGQDYQIGDVLTITGGNNDATLVVDILGKGDYRLFRGVNKQYAYWI